ncbi:MAG: pyridoxal-phosphate dependent enzyme [Acidobacteria bacterium]|nr:pyridoxal-phosphate dependent enzyme [Acidobacteriota bacterium]
MGIVSFENICQAAARVRPYIHRTPVLTCTALDRMAGASLYFKCENFQRAGAFKYRGACNAVFSLSDDRAKRGVATHSSGNHAGALARAAQVRGIPARVVMPENAPEVKVEAVRGYGAQVIFCEPNLEARETALNRLVEESGAVFVHPYDTPLVIAGQGTAAVELITDAGNLDIVLAPVGGGGLLSGTAISTKTLLPQARVFGTEPKQADDAFRSFRSGVLVPSRNPNTIADGLLTSLGKLTFPLIRQFVDDILTVSEEGIKKAMALIWERMKILVEPSSAVALAAVLEHPEPFRNRRVGIILSGGNVDLKHLPWTGV